MDADEAPSLRSSVESAPVLALAPTPSRRLPFRRETRTRTWIAGVLLAAAGACARSADAPPTPAPDSGASCSATIGSAPSCSRKPKSAWSVVTPTTRASGMLPLISSAVAGFIPSCPRRFTVTWDATSLRLPGVSRLELQMTDGEVDRFASPFVADPANPEDGCFLALTRADGSYVASVPCRFEGCYSDVRASEVDVLVGRVRVSSGGYEVDTTIEVPVCEVWFCT